MGQPVVVGCLSLVAKVEERYIPLLLDLYLVVVEVDMEVEVGMCLRSRPFGEWSFSCSLSSASG